MHLGSIQSTPRTIRAAQALLGGRHPLMVALERRVERRVVATGHLLAVRVALVPSVLVMLSGAGRRLPVALAGGGRAGAITSASPHCSRRAGARLRVAGSRAGRLWAGSGPCLRDRRPECHDERSTRADVDRNAAAQRRSVRSRGRGGAEAALRWDLVVVRTRCGPVPGFAAARVSALRPEPLIVFVAESGRR